MNKQIDLLKDDIVQLFLKYVIPSVSGMITVSLYIMADTIFIGQGIGGNGLAALNIALPIFNILFATGLLFGIGGATVISISRGKGETKNVNSIFTHSVIAAFFISILYTIFGTIFLEPIAVFLGATKENLTLVREYLSIILMFAFAFSMVYTLTPLVRNDKAPKLAMVSTVAGGMINIVLDGLFIMVFNWGMRGAAAATVISAFLSLIILVTHFIRSNTSLKLEKTSVRWEMLTRIYRNGIASFIIEVSSGIVIFSFNIVILGIIGQIGVSAYSIIANISLICVAIFTGIAQGIQPLISINYGARLLDRVNKIKNMGVACAVVFGGLFLMIGVLFPQQLISIFTTGNKEIMDITVKGIRYYFIGFIFMGANIVMGGYFQSIELSGYATVISMGRGIGFVLIGLFILSKLFEIEGVWMTIPFAEITTCILALVISFKQDKFSELVLEEL